MCNNINVFYSTSHFDFTKNLVAWLTNRGVFEYVF